MSFEQQKSYNVDSSTFYCANVSKLLEYKKQKIEQKFKEFPKEYFVCHGTAATPLIKIDNSYFLKYPCDEQMCRILIKDSEKAPFGRGEETIVDSAIRDSWQIYKKIEMISHNIKENSKILEEIRLKLCPGCSSIRAEFYKMLVYEEGSHFKAHKDTIRDVKHFGSLIVFLPSFYKGGEFQVRHSGEQLEYQYSMDEKEFDISKCHWVAFFTDCEHEIKPLMEGNRVVLTYHLYYEGDNAPNALNDEKMQLIQDF
jgi:Rps23 Pro-64 3,4-dihydroxylase Tpa1-like proline 4-hydroxylase